MAHSGGWCIIHGLATGLYRHIFGVLCSDDPDAVRPFLSPIDLWLSRQNSQCKLVCYAGHRIGYREPGPSCYLRRRAQQPVFRGASCVHVTASCATPWHLLTVVFSFCPAIRCVKPDADYPARGRVAPVENRRYSSLTRVFRYPSQRDTGRALLSVSWLLTMDGDRRLCVA